MSAETWRQIEETATENEEITNLPIIHILIRHRVLVVSIYLEARVVAQLTNGDDTLTVTDIRSNVSGKLR